jgi:Bifunctional DNA primase/polymerase, N-terminal
MSTFITDPQDEPETTPIYGAEEACRAAIALAVNTGYCCFPCTENKTPVRHPQARVWFHQHEPHIPATRTYRTLHGGIYLYFRHADGVKSIQGKGERLGIDTRGDGGYVIAWFATGLECLAGEDELHTPIAPWPAWLMRMFWPTAPQPEPTTVPPSVGAPDAAINGLLRVVLEAQEGSRNGRLFWAGCRMREYIGRGSISEGKARQTLLSAAQSIGLSAIEASRTIASAKHFVMHSDP